MDVRDILTNMGELGDHYFDEMRNHKNWCDDLDCHVYVLLQRAMSEIASKNKEYQRSKT